MNQNFANIVKVYFIYKYYTAKFMPAREDNKLRNYYDNKILGKIGDCLRQV